MVTRTVILVTPSEAAAFDATTILSAAVAATSLSTPAATTVAESVVISNAPAEQNSTELQLKICNYPSCTNPAQHTSPGGLVQLCRHEGCYAVDFEKGGGLCCVHQKNQKEPTDGDQSDSEDASKDDRKIRGVASDEGLSDLHSTHDNNHGLDNEVGKKRALTSEDSISGKDDIKRQRVDAFTIDLSDVPPQSPIPKSAGYIKEGSSKYTGVYFNKQTKKWHTEISINGKSRSIGSSENEEEAGADYARAVFKYKGQGALGKAREQDSFIIDLSDVPPQSPIPKSSDYAIKEGASKYIGVTFDKQKNKWRVQIVIEGKQRYIGSYENEEAAAVDYARAVFKYKGQGALDKAREQSSFIIDLTDVPPQPPIPNSEVQIKEASSKYIGVTFNKLMNKWYARIMIEGKNRHIGCYESEEEAAVDYARAVFKYKGQGALDKARERRTRDKAGERNSFIIDLSDVSSQSPIPKCAGLIKVGASKYTGVSFCKQRNKWKAQINIDGKNRGIGHYENEEEAAVDYARAVFKYKGQGALDKAREQNSFIIDLTDVPPQPPIPKCASHIEEGASKYKGVSFDKRTNKWYAQIYIEGKQRAIGTYENEEEAGSDYARAVFKYKGQWALDKLSERRARDKSEGQNNSFIIDLSDVPPQSPIPKVVGQIKDGASKYTGVHFDKQRNKKWTAQITIEGKNRNIGRYENEEEAAVDYARALFKYKGQGALDKARERRALGKAREQNPFIIDLSGVPPQPPITKSAGLIKEGASTYTGVSFDKRTNKWLAKIRIDGKQRYIGSYENEETAAVDYARAVFKYRGQFGT